MGKEKKINYRQKSIWGLEKNYHHRSLECKLLNVFKYFILYFENIPENSFSAKIIVIQVIIVYLCGIRTIVVAFTDKFLKKYNYTRIHAHTYVYVYVCMFI